jgi:hypothetical protein
MAGVGPAYAGIPARLALSADLATSVVRLLSRALRRGPVGRRASAVTISEVIGRNPDTKSTSNGDSEQPAHRANKGWRQGCTPLGCDGRSYNLFKRLRAPDN